MPNGTVTPMMILSVCVRPLSAGTGCPGKMTTEGKLGKVIVAGRLGKLRSVGNPGKLEPMAVANSVVGSSCRAAIIFVAISDASTVESKKIAKMKMRNCIIL